MVRRSPSVFNNLLSGLYAEEYGIRHIPKYTNWTSLNNIIITCYWHLTSDILDLYWWDLWHNTLSYSPLTYDIYATVLNYLTCLFLGFHTVFYTCFSIQTYRYTCIYLISDLLSLLQVPLCYLSLPVPVCLNHIIWSCTRVTAWARQLILSYVLTVLLSDNPVSSCLDLRVWTVVALL